MRSEQENALMTVLRQFLLTSDMNQIIEDIDVIMKKVN